MLMLDCMLWIYEVFEAGMLEIDLWSRNHWWKRQTGMHNFFYFAPKLWVLICFPMTFFMFRLLWYEPEMHIKFFRHSGINLWALQNSLDFLKISNSNFWGNPFCKLYYTCSKNRSSKWISYLICMTEIRLIYFGFDA